MSSGAVNVLGFDRLAQATACAEAGSHGGIFSNGVFKMNLTSKEATWMLGSIRLFQRLRYHKWIKPLYPSRDALYPRGQLEAAQRRMEAGELPPLLPSEVREGAKRSRNGALCCA